MLEIIALVVAIVGLVIALKTYKKQVLDPDTHARQILLEKIDYAKRLNENLTERLITYVTMNNCMDEIFMQGLTFRQSISILHDVRQNLFGSEIQSAINIISSSKEINPIRLKNILDGIEVQIKHHTEIDTSLKHYLNC